MCALTEVSQTEESGGLQLGVAWESLAGSHCNPLDAVQYQDVVVTLYKVTQIRRKPGLDRFSLSTGKHSYPDE